MVSIIYGFLLKLDAVPLVLQYPSGSLARPRCVRVCSVFIGSAKFGSMAGKSHFNRLGKVSCGRVGEREAVPGSFQAL